jgi:hypothetical protein
MYCIYGLTYCLYDIELPDRHEANSTEDPAEQKEGLPTSNIGEEYFYLGKED